MRKTMEEKQKIIRDAADAGFNEMFLHIQKELGVDDGGLAGAFWTTYEDEATNYILPILYDYFCYEEAS